MTDLRIFSTPLANSSQGSQLAPVSHKLLITVYRGLLRAAEIRDSTLLTSWILMYHLTSVVSTPRKNSTNLHLIAILVKAFKKLAAKVRMCYF